MALRPSIFRKSRKRMSSGSELKCENRILRPFDGKHLETPVAAQRSMSMLSRLLTALEDTEGVESPPPC